MYLLSMCDKSYMLEIFLIIKIFLQLVCYIVPLIIIIISIISLFKVIQSGKQDDMKDTLKIFARRIISGLIVIFIPTLVNYVFTSLIDGSGVEIVACMESATKEKVESLKEAEEAEAAAEAEAQAKEDEEAQKAAYEEEHKNDDAKKEAFEEAKNNHSSSNNTSGNNSTNGDFYYSETIGDNPNYKGHSVNLTAAQKLKVARALMGERSDADLGTYIGLCQYIRDYIDYGNVSTRSYDSIGSSWLRSASRDITDYPIDWFETNRPNIIEAIDYVFGKGGSAFQGLVTFYIDNADYGSGNENNDSAINSKINSWMHSDDLASDHGVYQDDHQIIYSDYSGGNRTVWVICKQACGTRSNTKVNNNTKNS